MPRILICRVSASFNKEAFVDFIAAQIKTLSFLAYIIRIYQVSDTYSTCFKALVSMAMLMLKLDM